MAAAILLQRVQSAAAAAPAAAPLPVLPCPPSLDASPAWPLLPSPTVVPVQQVKKMTPLDPEAVTPFVGEALRRLRAEVRLPAP